MKKLTLFLAAALLAASFAACGNSGASSSTAPEPTAIPDDILNAPATKPDPDMEIDPGFGVDPEDSSAALQPEPDAELSGIVDQIYAAHPVDLMMVETTAVDLTNAEWYPYQTGLNEEQITKVDAAVTSEPGVGSQAYCMVLVRLKDKANGDEIAEAMLGATVGMLVSNIADRKHIRFETQAVWWAQLIKLAVGFGCLLAIRSGLKAPLIALLGGNAAIAGGIRYLLVVLFAGCVWPLTFWGFRRVGKR